MRSPTGASTVELWVNGERRRVSATDVRSLLVALGLDPAGRGLAVARNGEVVPRGAWDTTALAPDDRIDIVGAVQGG
jgi:sulfur carrier protein